VVSLVVGALLSVAVAFLFLRHLDPDGANERLAGESLILAPAIPATALFLFSLCAIPWHRLPLFLAGATAMTLLLFATRRKEKVKVAVPERERPGLELGVALVMMIAVLLLLAGYAQFAFVTAGAENDFIGIWGAKGRTFYEAGGIDWAFLSSSWRGYAHPDYPLLVPLVFSAVSVAGGSWSESTLGLVYPILALGGLILAYSEFRSRTTSSALRALGVLAVSPFVMSPWIGLADGPLALFAAAAVLRMARWLDGANRSELVVAAVFLGAAMSTKNEGIAIGVVAATMLIAVTRGDRRKTALVSLWPAAAIVLPWLVLRAVHGLSTDLFESGFAGRLLARILDARYLSALAGYLVEFRPGRPLVYLLFALIFVIWWRRLQTGARFIGLVVIAQLVIDIGAYLVTPLPLEWHVRWSWERLVSQVGAVLAISAVCVLLERVGEGSGGGRFASLVGSGPEVEHEEPDSDADR